MIGHAPQHAFLFDARACAGCKACQIACKDKHGLEVGRLWRRVYEVSGGGWLRSGDAWRSEVFAFHLSIACNHCEKPICVEVCPSRALRQRDDGIVLLDTERCLGCSLCEWACPYGAPQYDAARGCMTKCTFCADELDAGREPVCVTACPLRVLEHGPGGAGPQEAPLRQDPLPDPRLTEPALVMEEHRDAARARGELIEVVPRKRHELHEWSLVVFTMLTQLAAGSVVVLAGLHPLTSDRIPDALDERIWTLVVAGMTLALLFSLRHLGSPQRAWRVLANLRSSWLSRELCAALSLLAVGALAVLLPDRSPMFLALGTLAGLALVLVMSRVYMLRTVPRWSSLSTPLSFLTTSLLLGSLAVTLLAAPLRDAALGVTIVLIVLRRLVAWMRDREVPESTYLPLALSAVAGLLLIALFALAPEASGAPRDTLLLWLATALLLCSEALERLRFFRSYARCGL